MKKQIVLCGLLTFCLIQVIAQTNVLRYNIILNIKQLQQKKISGYTEIIFIPEVETNKISFDLVKLQVTEVIFNQTVLQYNQNDSVLFINLPFTANKTDTLTLKIYYNGQPVTDATWGGFYFSGDYAYNMGVAFANYPHNFGRCWFPCNDNFTDRALFEFNITTDIDFKAICNGLFLNQTVNSDNSVTWKWKLNQPIPTYLANVAVGKYIFITDTFVGLERKIPILIAVEPKDSAKAIASFVNLKSAMQCFENKFGPYNFDRIGYVAVPFNAGAMEHASNISYPIYALDGTLNFETLMAHELSHMWFGNTATCATSSDMWLNEGWASFCEAEFLDCLYGKKQYYDEISENQFQSFRFAHARDGGYKSISGVTKDITYGTHVYKKGSLAAHNLKLLMGETDFYRACKSFLNKYKFNNVTTQNLIEEFQKFTTANVNDLIEKWVLDKGNYNVVFNNFEMLSNNEVRFGLVQTKKYANQFLNTIPVVVTFFDSFGNTKEFYYKVAKQINGIKEKFDGNFYPKYATINYYNGFALAKTYQIETIKGTGVRNFGRTMFSMNVRTNSDSIIFLVEHNFTPPNQDEVEPEKVRISPDRYWRIDGYWTGNFAATGFFNYDGSTNQTTGFLDTDLFYHAKREDSLVLLYRELPQQKWKIHEDYTFQPGSNLTDLSGRFRVNELKKGEYAFGVIDATTSIKYQKSAHNGSIKIYPNPANNTLHIDGLNNHQFKYIIQNISGKTLQKGVCNRNVIDISKLAKGLYFLVFEENDFKQTTRFVKE
ncbi:MAG: M1 family aminopeptidase [Bacteroidia bacterium]